MLYNAMGKLIDFHTAEEERHQVIKMPFLKKENYFSLSVRRNARRECKCLLLNWAYYVEKSSIVSLLVCFIIIYLFIYLFIYYCYFERS